MKKIKFLFIFTIISFSLYSQTSLSDFKNIVTQSKIIVEGKVIDQNCFEFENNIFTENIILVKKYFKGGSRSSNKLSVITLGGKVGNKIQNWTHTLVLKKNQVGIFLLEQSSVQKNSLSVVQGTSGFFSESQLNVTYNSTSYSFLDYKELEKHLINYSNEAVSFRNEMIYTNDESCLEFKVNFISSSISTNVAFEISIRSQISGRALDKLVIPIFFKPEDFDLNPFIDSLIIISLANDLTSNNSLNLQMLSADKALFEILSLRNKFSDKTIIPIEFYPVLKGKININQTNTNQIPRFEILNEILLSNSFYVTATNSEQQQWTCLNPFETDIPRITPEIDSIFPLNVAAGVGDMSENEIPGKITIIGKNFGIPASGQNTAGSVGFINAENLTINGAPTSLIFPAQQDYEVWNDSVIVVRVPSRENNTSSDWSQGVATSGIIKVFANNDTIPSDSSLHVHFGMANDYYQDSIGIKAQKRRMSNMWGSFGNGGYLLKVEKEVIDSIPGSLNAINAALDTWRCEQGHPIWIKVDTSETGLYTGSITRAKLFNTNALAQTSVVETHHDDCKISVSNSIRIIINARKDISTTPDTLEYDLQSILTHEFGHAFLLRHTVNLAVMYPVARKFPTLRRVLGADDHLGGEHTYLLGKNGPICDPGGYDRNQNLKKYICITSNESIETNQNNFHVFPNPVSQIFYITSLVFHNSKYKLYNLQGKIIDEGILEKGKNKISLKNLISGVYFLFIIDERNNYVQKEKIIKL